MYDPMKVHKISDDVFDIRVGDTVVAKVSRSQHGWRVGSRTSARRSSKRLWPSAEEAVYAYYKKTGDARRLRDEVRDAKLPYVVIDLKDLASHGDYPTLDEARGCVAFDDLKEWQIWQNGNVLVDFCENA